MKKFPLLDILKCIHFRPLENEFTCIDRVATYWKIWKTCKSQGISVGLEKSWNLLDITNSWRILSKRHSLFTALLLGHSQSARLFSTFFQYQWQYDTYETWGSDARVVGRNTRQKRTTYISEITKNTLKTINIIGSIISPKDSLSVKILK